MRCNGKHCGTPSIRQRVCRPRQRPLRGVILSAHPDDEVIGVAATMMRLDDIFLMYLTDGAPFDQALWPSHVARSRSAYARIRRNEGLAAAEIAGVMPERVMFLGAVDQEAIWEVVPRASYFSALLRIISPDIVITHPYEGGHPDHEAAALVARLALRILQQVYKFRTHLLEMTSYHARDASLVTGEFLPTDRREDLAVDLSAEEVRLKRRMFDAHHSQARVLRDFSVGFERLRYAPDYNFTEPPHGGKLWYECLGWPMTGERWRSLARTALSEVEQLCD